MRSDGNGSTRAVSSGGLKLLNRDFNGISGGISVIAHEVSNHYDGAERKAAKEFARSHRLSIAHAFHRKLVRKDVVVELSRLYEAK